MPYPELTPELKAKIDAELDKIEARFPEKVYTPDEKKRIEAMIVFSKRNMAEQITLLLDRVESLELAFILAEQYRQEGKMDRVEIQIQNYADPWMLNFWRERFRRLRKRNFAR
jgi:hypothetical protein